MRLRWRVALSIVGVAACAFVSAGCGGSPSRESAAAPGAGPVASPGTSVASRVNGVVLITIDTLRADRVGAYGWRAARTPAIDALAARGVRAEQAYATAPITLVSHASLLTGLDPPRHGARHNGLRLRAGVPTLAEQLRARGFATGAFIAAFPLDRRFGLDRGFDTYGDALPRGADGVPRNERPGRVVVDEALEWMGKQDAAKPFFLWVHLFEPHAPYEGDDTAPAVGGDGAVGALAGVGAGVTGVPGGVGRADSGAASPRPVSLRYDDEVARADAQVARLMQALQPRLASTLVILASDHGEAFGEHGEVGHSIFVYDTTLRVPLVLAGPGIGGGAAAASGAAGGVAAGGARSGSGVGPSATAGAGPGGGGPGSGSGRGVGGAAASGRPGRVMTAPVSLVDIMPTVLDLLKLPPVDGDGVSLLPLLSGGGTLGPRALYAESFAPLLDFGWSPLRALRTGGEKYIAAPKPELYDLARDPGESRNLLRAAADANPDAARHAARAGALAAQVERLSPADIAPGDPGTAGGGVGGGAAAGASPGAAPGAASSATSGQRGTGAATAGAASAGSAGRAAGLGAAASAPPASGQTAADRETEARLRSLGYLASAPPGALASRDRGAPASPSASGPAGSTSRGGGAGAAGAGAVTRVDPKDRIAIAARIAEVTSGELHGSALRAALERLVKEDPRNGQMRMRLGVVLQEAGDCRAAMPHFRAAIAAAVPSADPHLGLAECLGAAGQGGAAREALLAADRVEPGNPIVSANLGLLALEEGRTAEAIDRLRAALTRAPDLHPVRFALARAYGRAGQRADAAREARELLARLPPDAPQRAEVQRLLAAVQ